MELHYESVLDVKKEHWPWKNFLPAELACRGSGAVKINVAAMDCLQALRDDIGVPMLVNSAYRSPEYNERIGGAPNSQHMYGRAFDISLPALERRGVSRDDFYHAAVRAGFTGIGQYDTFMHIDNRDGYARWDERS